MTADQYDKSIPIILEAQKKYKGYTVPVTFGSCKNALMMNDKLTRAPWHAAAKSKPKWKQRWITTECNIENITDIIKKPGYANFPVIHVKPMKSPNATKVSDYFKEMKPTPMSEEEWAHIKTSVEHYEQFGRIKSMRNKGKCWWCEKKEALLYRPVELRRPVCKSCFGRFNTTEVKPFRPDEWDRAWEMIRRTLGKRTSILNTRDIMTTITSFVADRYAP